MAQEEIKIPSLGESVSEGVIVSWLKEDGDFVDQGAPVLELETDKVTMEIVSPFTGRLSIKVPADSTVSVGQVVATVDTEAKGGEGKEPEPEPEPEPEKKAPETEAPSERPTGELSPAVRRMVVEHDLDPGEIPSTGPGGRITKEDVVGYLKEREGEAQEAPPPREERRREAAPPRTEGRQSAEVAPPPKEGGGREARQTRSKMSPFRQRVAERLVAAQRTAAILTTFNEADMSAVMAWRSKHKEAFKKKHEVGLGFMSFFVKAAVDALRTVPRLNAQIDGDQIVQNHYYDIGVAVGTEHGLVVPVIRDCDRIGFDEIERRIADVAGRARSKKLTIEELSGGCFTISNGGVYGSMLSTPILNPPQSGILGLHAIKKRPVVVGDEIQIRPMMYLALSYDHRLVDGAEAVTFLKRIVECIEDPERMWLGV